MNDMNSGIYEIRNLVNGKVYVGQTNNFSHRKRQHFKELDRGLHYNQYLQRSYLKYGKDCFKFEVLERCGCDLLNERERCWIEKLESEYANKGYNAPYHYIHLERYKDGAVVNSSKRNFNNSILSDDVRAKARIGIISYWENITAEDRLKYSDIKSTMSRNLVAKIKEKLAFEFKKSISEVAEEFMINKDKITHISRHQSFTLIRPELNHLIDTRTRRFYNAQNKRMIRLWCQGKTYSYIEKDIGIDKRNIIRRLKELRNSDIDRCRLNAINYEMNKRYSQIKTMKRMGLSVNDICNSLNFSRGYVGGMYYADGSKIHKDCRHCSGIDRSRIAKGVMPT